MVTCPSSIGWRSISSTSRGNSGSSSRNSTPLMRQADLARPRHAHAAANQAGVGNACGAASGTAARAAARPAVAVAPATLWILVVSSASSNVSGGRMPAKRFASIALARSRRPDHQHDCARRPRPLRERAWPSSCPRTSRKSGSGGRIRRRARRCVGTAGWNSSGRVSRATTSASDLHPKYAARPPPPPPLPRFRPARSGSECHDRARTPPPRARRARRAPRHRARARRSEYGPAPEPFPWRPACPTAMGRSNPAPSLRTLAGARLMVNALLG